MQTQESRQRRSAAHVGQIAIGVACGVVLGYVIGIAPMYWIYWTPVSVLALEALAVVSTRSPRLRVFALSCVVAGVLFLSYSFLLIVALGGFS